MGFIEPCVPTLAHAVPDGSRWAFELKHDGFRFIARRDDDRVRVFSRNAKDWTDKVPMIVEAMLALPYSPWCSTGRAWWSTSRMGDVVKVENPDAPATRLIE
jgi:ATP-dependent DNA ligase